MAHAMAQTPYPDYTIQDVAWTEGTHHFSVAHSILSPGSTAMPVDISGTADAEFVSGTQVRLRPGFHAGSFSGGGRFRARIDEAWGTPLDVVLIAPDPNTSLVSNVLHVPKWEKVEVGLRLPEEYQDAVDRFFEHYYSNTTDPDLATPDSLDNAHDLNPYADDSLQLLMTLVDPNSVTRLKWGFYMKEAKWASNNIFAKLTEDFSDPMHPYHARYRIAPDVEGLWQFSLSIAAPNTVTLGNQALPAHLKTGYAFVCDPPLPDNKGPLHVNPVNRRTLQFENGESYLALGTNLNPAPLGTTWSNPFTYQMTKGAYDTLANCYRLLHDVGGNFSRTWLSDKSFAPEHVNVGVYDRYRDGLSCDNNPIVRGNGQFQAWAFDQLLDSLREKGIYLQLSVVPYPPIIDYESFAWHNDGYLNTFVKPRDSITNLYDMKRYFYLDGDTTIRDSGPFYFWKRYYKYLMSRWGYSVNVPIIEPFQEIDQMLTYGTVDLSVDSTNGATCAENAYVWPADPELPKVIDQWITDISSFVRGEQVLNDPTNSPLGEGDKLFMLSYAGGYPAMPNAADYYRPFLNEAIDILDAHKGMGNEWDLHAYGSGVNDYRDTFTSGGLKKPFNHGEFTHYSSVPGWNDKFEGIFHNYNPTFHNELWSSAFSGKFAAGTTWIGGRVFWLANTLPLPPQDFGNEFQQNFSRTLGATNDLDIGLGFAIPIKNRRVHHHFRPLADLLAHPSWTAYDFFNGDYTAHTYYDDTNANRIESYYLKSADSTVAIGWVHNRNAWVKNYHYVRNSSSTQNFLGCTSPADTSIVLPGFLDSTEYHITWFPTWLGSTVVPLDTVWTSTGTGELLLDLSTAPLGDTIAYFLDTLHSDYAFIITVDPFVKSGRRGSDTSAETVSDEWDFSLFPNPARSEVFLKLPHGLPKEIVLLDAMGRQIRSWSGVSTKVLSVNLSELSSGAYAIRVSDGQHARTKKLMIP